jgi:hypothetical protein
LKKSLVVGLKGLDAKMNSLAVNRQSLSKFDFDFDLNSLHLSSEVAREM